MRCIFSESLNDNALHVSPGRSMPPPGKPRPSFLPREFFTSASILLRSVARSVADDLVTTLFPTDCRTCNNPLARSTPVPICDACRNRIRRQTTTLCHLCGEALPMESAPLCRPVSCRRPPLLPCRIAPPMFERAVAHAVYQDELREMIHLLKYERMHAIARPLGQLLAQTVLQLEPEAAGNLTVVAVPLSPTRQRQRGYNQSELLADAATTELRTLRPNWHLTRPTALLTRHRETQSQFELTPRGRRRNVEGAFAITPGKLTLGCEVLLIDDIYTTGATARECARVLRRAGARKVWVATLARAQTPQIAMWDEADIHAPRTFT